MTLGEKIQWLRKSCGLSQMQLGEQLNVSRQSVSKWELDESVPDINKIVMLSELFSVSADELLKDNSTAGTAKESCESESVIENVVQMNFAHNLIAIGIRSIICGLVLMILECLFLPVLAAIQKAQVNGQGFYTDFMKYAAVWPMPVIFMFTIIIIVLGILLVFKGRLCKRNIGKRISVF